jgi:hypothetical protein
MLAKRFQKLLISGLMLDIVILNAGSVYGGILVRGLVPVP